jgi:hypothetical protein
MTTTKQTWAWGDPVAHCTLEQRKDDVLVVHIRRAEDQLPFFQGPILWARPFGMAEQDETGDDEE